MGAVLSGTLGTIMKLTRRTSNILLAIGVYMLLTWGFRVFTSLVAPAVHLSLVVIGLTIGVYLTYLGIKGRRATGSTP